MQAGWNDADVAVPYHAAAELYAAQSSEKFFKEATRCEHVF